MNAIEVGKRIRYFRENRGLTKNKLSEKAGVSPTYIYQVENGEKCPTVEYLSYICFGLGITLTEFFSVDPDSDGNSEDESLLDEIQRLSPDEKTALLTLLKKR